MKRDFFDLTFELMKDNKDIYLIMAGLGYPRYEEFKTAYPDRVINTEASEQTALDICVGLSYSGKIPFLYTITPFLLRGWETIRTFLNYESLHCVLIGAGQEDDYSKHDGFSHDAQDIKEHFDIMKNFKQYYPMSVAALKLNLAQAIKDRKPNFINIRK